MNNEINSELDLLERIVTLLLSLARMAECASGRSRPICALLMWILKPAGAAVSAYADFPPDALPFDRSGNVREDAVRLAVRFRMLAELVIDEAERLLRLVTPRRSRTRTAQAKPARIQRVLGLARKFARLVTRKWPDTS
jgi:hypothetical protein